jgi:hypothetical protein
LEKKLNYAYETGKLHKPFIDFLNKYNFFFEGKIRLSNEIPALLSGTTRNGNSLKGVIDWISNNGIFPQSVLLEDFPMSWSAYYDRSKITPEMLAIGKESLEYLTINYTIITDKSQYPKYSGGIKWEIFDNYLDPVDGDFVKRLAPDYIIAPYGYKVILQEIIINVKKNIMLERKNGEEKVHLIINNCNYWIKAGEDFDNLKAAQPISIGWEDVKVVDELSVPWDGEKIIGSQPNKTTILNAIILLFKNLFGGKK